MKWLWLGLVLLSCVSKTPEKTSYGLSDEAIAFIPAKIAIIPCAIWPSEAKFAALYPSTVQADIKDQTCKNFDAFVASGFRGQPYVIGISPNAVGKALDNDGSKQKILKFWQSRQVCPECLNAAGFYNSRLAQDKSWQELLDHISSITKGCDAILMPWIHSIQNSLFDDRGLQREESRIDASMLLISTTTGKLLWSRGREAVVRQSLNSQAPRTITISWKEVEARLFVESFWLGFPGRQSFILDQ